MALRYSLVAAFILSGGPFACGHSDAEMRVKDDAIAKLTNDRTACRKELADTQESAAVAQRRAQAAFDDLQQTLEQMKGRVSPDQARTAQALSEYHARADLLVDMHARVVKLNNLLLPLRSNGIQLGARYNRIIITLPADALFAEGLDVLTTRGKQVVHDVGVALLSDPVLAKRNYQLAGFTDNQSSGTGVHDNWVLSFARARTIMLALTTDAGMSATQLSAAGYGRTLPIAGTLDSQTAAEQARNRRVEMVMQADINESINYQELVRDLQ